MATLQHVEIETDPDFNIHTSIHNDFFLLRTRVLVNDKNTEIRSIRNGKYVRAVFYYSGNDTGIKLLLVVNTVSTVLHQYGVYHVDTFYCGVQSLLFRTVFSTELCLKKFILAIGEIKSALELQLQTLFTIETKSVQQLTVKVQSELFLVSPSQQKAKRPEINLVTAENYSNSLIRWKDSELFDFRSLYQEEATPPKVTSQPMGLKNVLPGKGVEFSVQATGTLPLGYEWQWKQFGKDEWQNLTGERPATELKLASVHSHNAGYYRCVVSNCAGNTTSQCARLTVVPELHELVSELQDVIDWIPFGLHLGIKMPRLESIKADCPTLDERRIQMLNEWQKNVTPTWSVVVETLANMGMRQLASDLAQKHGVPPPKLPKPQQLKKLPQQEKLTGSKQETQEHRGDVSQDHRNLMHAEEHLEHAQELKVEANKKASEVVTKVEKLRKKVQKISQEKSSLEMKLKIKEREYQMMLSAMHEKDEVYNQFLREKISKKKEKIKRLKEELCKKENEFQSVHQEAQTLRNELSLAQLELKKKHEEVMQLQREKEKLAYSDHVEQFNKLLQITVADKEEMKQQLASMKYESELKSQQIEACNANISHLSKQMEALSSSLQDKEVAVAQLQSELQAYQQVANSPEQLIKSLKLAELKHKLQEAVYQKQQAELEREAALQEMKARQRFEVQVHTQLIDPPKVTQHPKSQSVFTGAQVTFKVEATGDDLTFQWLKNGSDVHNDSNYSGTDTSTLMIQHVKKSDGGCYSCLVKNEAKKEGEVSDEAQLEVFDPPKVTQHPKSQSVFTGAQATFKVEATGDDLTFQWQKDGSDVHNDSNYSGTDTMTLMIQHVKKSDGGCYRCLVRNEDTENGEVSDKAQLTVLNQLNPDKSLQEQRIEETTTLGKKFFFPDQNVDRDDPIQFNQLYVQSRDAIIDGTHPCTCENTIQLAALQCQVQYGNHNEAKHKAGFLNLDKFLPREYIKIRRIEKLIFAEHRKLHNLSEQNAKYRYIQLCRSLHTYGGTFFLVKIRGRNKLVPCLLGITRENIMRMDVNTKEVLKTWPLTTVRRWSSSPNSFTLDFGDHSDSFYSVQTTEGETISQAINNYVDIIAQRKQLIHSEVEEHKDKSVMDFEVDPKKASVTTFTRSEHDYQGGMVHLDSPYHAALNMGPMMSQGQLVQHQKIVGTPSIQHKPPSQALNPQLIKAQCALRDNIQKGLLVCKQHLTRATTLPPLETDSASVKWKQRTLDVSQHNVTSTLAAMLASTAAIIILTGGDPTETNYTTVGFAVTTISTNLTELFKAVRLLAALGSTNLSRDELLKSVRSLTAATSGLLNASQPENIVNRRQLLSAAGEMGTVGDQLLLLVGDPQVDPQTQEALVAMAKTIEATTATLVTNARNVAARCEDQALQWQVIMTAKQVALATQGIIACTKVLVPCIDSPLCHEQLIEAHKMVAAAVEKIVLTAQAACGDDSVLGDLREAATKVMEALNSLSRQVKEGVWVGQDDEAAAAIPAATERLFSSTGNAQEMVKQAKILAKATYALINAIKIEADAEMDLDTRQCLLDPDKPLVDATSKMVESLKGITRNPHDGLTQEALCRAAEHLRAVTNVASCTALKKKAIKKLEIAAKDAAAMATQCIVAARGTGVSNHNEASQTQLISHCNMVEEQISALVQSVRSSMANPDSPSTRLSLINSSQALITPSDKMVAAAKVTLPTVVDKAAALLLGNFAKVTEIALAELRAASAKAAEECGYQEINSATDMGRALSQDMTGAKEEGQLFSLSGEPMESCAEVSGATSTIVGSSMAQLPTTFNQVNQLNPDKSLQEQETKETATLGKKLFFSDHNVDRDDSIQLNQLYVQSHKTIIDGTHPCTHEEAVYLAALQCQVQYGNHNEAKHKAGFLNLVEFLPREYVHVSGIEKLVLAEHRKLYNLSEQNAKYRYIQLCHSPHTYGVTFLVKEKMCGCNKLVPRLLGITRENIMRMDVNTKEALETWPLTTIRRWAASPNSFTLDFGDYAESFYSVQTTEGETISQLIGSYIDILLLTKTTTSPLLGTDSV